MLILLIAGAFLIPAGTYNTARFTFSDAAHIVFPIFRHQTNHQSNKYFHIQEHLSAVSSGLSADYVLFDCWFANPAQIIAIKFKEMDVIAMIKKSSRIQYQSEKQKLNIKQFYAKNKKRCGRSQYLPSVNVMVEKEIQFRQKSYVSRTRRIVRIGLLLSVQIQICQKKKSSVSMENAGRKKCFSKPANLHW